MNLVDLIEKEIEQTAQERAAIEVYTPESDKLSSPAPILVPRGQRLDVDAVLARSLPNTGAFATRDVKTIVLR